MSVCVGPPRCGAARKQRLAAASYCDGRPEHGGRRWRGAGEARWRPRTGPTGDSGGDKKFATIREREGGRAGGRRRVRGRELGPERRRGQEAGGGYAKYSVGYNLGNSLTGGRNSVGGGRPGAGGGRHAVSVVRDRGGKVG